VIMRSCSSTCCPNGPAEISSGDLPVKPARRRFEAWIARPLQHGEHAVGARFEARDKLQRIAVQFELGAPFEMILEQQSHAHPGDGQSDKNRHGCSGEQPQPHRGASHPPPSVRR
jgi:hypothetical protein